MDGAQHQSQQQPGVSGPLSDAAVDDFMASLPPEAANVLKLMSSAEGWALDGGQEGDHSDPEDYASLVSPDPLLDALSIIADRLEDLPGRPEWESLAGQIDPRLLEILSMLSTPRALILLNRITEADADFVPRIDHLDQVNDPSTLIERHVLFERLMLIARMDIIGRVFSRARRQAILDVLNERAGGVA